MENNAPSALKRFILWDYTRASWQYDVMVGLILAFIFFTPREWFRDQPRIPQAGSVVMLPQEHGAGVYWVEPELVTSIPEAERLARLSDILRIRTGKKQVQVTRIEPMLDAEGEARGYLAVTNP